MRLIDSSKVKMVTVKGKAVSRELYEAIKGEREAAIAQLAEHGICFGAKAPDVVKVVRCKDCRFGIKSCFGGGWRYCRNNQHHHKEDHFCSYGERRADDGKDDRL